MKAVLINCALRATPAAPSDDDLAGVVVEELRRRDVAVEEFRLAELSFDHAARTRGGEDDEWPRVHGAIVDSEILVVATPARVGRPSSHAQQMLERLAAMTTETHASGRPLAYGKVAGVVVTGAEEGAEEEAHDVISEISGGLFDIGFTIPGQAWTYRTRGPEDARTPAGHEWSADTARTMAQHLHEVADALSGLRT